MYFWGSWCGVCRYQSPIIDDLAADGVPVVGVAVRSGSASEVAAYTEKRGLGFPTVNDEDGSLSGAWRIVATPTVCFGQKWENGSLYDGNQQLLGLARKNFSGGCFQLTFVFVKLYAM
ncbi:unnamed protein product [Neisseria lactamica Y92-1009]|nr:unnamed protein product [Neisseria lactamica Y92-1009]